MARKQLGTAPSGSTDAARKTDVEALLPYHVSVPVTVPPTGTSGGSTLQYNAISFYNALAYTSGASGNYYEWNVALAAGTYILRTLYQKQDLAGIVRTLIDGTQVASVDTYAASPTVNQVQETSALALAAGRHTVRFVCDTKNASSTGYYILLHGFALARTGA